MIENYCQKIFDKYNFETNKSQLEKFSHYYSLLVETNKKFNLTAITEEEEVVVKHFLDSVLPLQEFSQNATVVDVGSGAGFPAIPLKIMRDDLQICMVDSLNKRVNFLNETVNALKLADILAVHARAEDFAKENREKFDIATARAVAELNTLVEYLLPLVKIGGQVIIYKSSKLEEEIKNAEKAINVLGGKIESIKFFKIEEYELERNILIIKKIAPTPNKYPRDKNKPKTNPIK